MSNETKIRYEIIITFNPKKIDLPKEDYKLLQKAYDYYVENNLLVLVDSKDTKVYFNWIVLYNFLLKRWNEWIVK